MPTAGPLQLATSLMRRQVEPLKHFHDLRRNFPGVGAITQEDTNGLGAYRHLEIPQEGKSSILLPDGDPACTEITRELREEAPYVLKDFEQYNLLVRPGPGRTLDRVTMKGDYKTVTSADTPTLPGHGIFTGWQAHFGAKKKYQLDQPASVTAFAHAMRMYPEHVAKVYVEHSPKRPREEGASPRTEEGKNKMLKLGQGGKGGSTSKGKNSPNRGGDPPEASIFPNPFVEEGTHIVVEFKDTYPHRVVLPRGKLFVARPFVGRALAMWNTQALCLNEPPTNRSFLQRKTLVGHPTALGAPVICISGEEALPGGKVVKREFMLAFCFWDLNEGKEDVNGGANPSGLGGAGTAMPGPSAPPPPPKATSSGKGKSSSPIFVWEAVECIL